MSRKENIRIFFEEEIMNLPTNVNNIGWVRVSDTLKVVDKFIEEQKVALPSYVRSFIQEMKEKNMAIDDAINAIQYNIVSESKKQLREWFTQEGTDNKERFVQGWVNGSCEEKNPVAYLTLQYPDGTKKRLLISETTADTILENMGESR